MAFWNLRSRTSAYVPGMPMVGIPHEALEHPEHLSVLRTWAVSRAGSRLSPDFMVAALTGVFDDVDVALDVAGFDRDRSNRRAHVFGSIPQRPRPTYAYGDPGIRGTFLRGAPGWSLITFTEGRTSVSLPQPGDLNVRSGDLVRLVFHDLPLPLPLTDPMARIVHEHATARDGVLLTVGSFGEWNLDLRLPDRGEALTSWAAGMGLTERQTQDGRYADLLLERLGHLDRLDALAAEIPIRILQALAPTSRVKLAQRLAVELGGEHEIDEHVLAERLRGTELFLELPSRPASDLTGNGARLRDVLSAIGPLVDAGYVVRGRSLRCPLCNFPLWFALDELAEQVRCDACRASFTLPVATTDGRREPQIEYRLDGLTARAMDQDLLPVLLALRAARHLFRGHLFNAWPGLELAAGGEATDVDLLAYGPWLLCCEVKLHAGSLGESQFQKLLRLCDRIGARPGLAALDGSFDEEFLREVQQREGQVFERAQLLA